MLPKGIPAGHDGAACKQAAINNNTNAQRYKLLFYRPWFFNLPVCGNTRVLYDAVITSIAETKVKPETSS